MTTNPRRRPSMLFSFVALALCCSSGGQQEGASDATGEAGSALASPQLDVVDLPGGAPGIGFDDMQWSEALGRVIVPGGRTGSVFLIDPDSKEVTALGGFSASKSYGGGHDFGTTSAIEAGGLVYALDRTTTELVQLDPKTKQRVHALKLHAHPDYVRYVASTRELWVTEPDSGEIEIIALGTEPQPSLKSVATFAVRGGPESLVIDAAHNRAYTNSFSGSTFAIDLKARTIVTTFKNGCALSLGIALDADKNGLFVACAAGELAAFSIDGKARGRDKIGAGVDIIAADAPRRRVFAPSGRTHELSVLSLSASGTLEKAKSVSVPSGGTCVVADGQGRAWVCDPVHGRVVRVVLSQP